MSTLNMDDELATYVVQAVAAYGHQAQRRQLQEEAAEVIVAVSHEARGRVGRQHLASELADLKIMIACVEAELAAAGVDLESTMRRSLSRAFAQLPGDL